MERAGLLLGAFVGLGGLSPPVAGVGLGPLRVESQLGRPLKAYAPIRLDGRESAENVKASLAAPSDYERVEADPSSLIERLRVHLVGSEPPRLQLTSRIPVRAPLFKVMVQVDHQGNRVSKVYTVTLDPPRVAQSETSESNSKGESAEAALPPPSRLPPTGLDPLSGVEPAPVSGRPETKAVKGWAQRDRYGPTQSGDTLSSIVRRVRQDPSVSLEAALVATWKANRSAFIDGNMHRLRQGATLVLPSENRIRGIAPEEARSAIRKQRGAVAGGDHSEYPTSLDPVAETPSRDTPNEVELNESQGRDSGLEANAPLAKLRTQVSQFRQALKDQHSATQSRLQDLVKRIAELRDQVQNQGKALKQSASLNKLTQQAAPKAPSGTSVQGNGALWLLAGINGLMVLAIIALWSRFRALQLRSKGTESAAAPELANGQAPPSETGEAPPLGESGVSERAASSEQGGRLTTRSFEEGIRAESPVGLEGGGSEPTQETASKEEEGALEFDLQLLREEADTTRPEEVSPLEKDPIPGSDAGEREWDGPEALSLESESSLESDSGEALTGEVSRASEREEMTEGKEEEGQATGLLENAEVTESSQAESSQEGLTNRQDWDVMLDLAQAWLDRGAWESARELLREIEAQGNLDQQKRAQRMLAPLH